MLVLFRGAYCPLNPFNKEKMKKQLQSKDMEKLKFEETLKEYQEILNQLIDEKLNSCKRSSDSESESDTENDSEDEFQMDYSDKQPKVCLSK